MIKSIQVVLNRVIRFFEFLRICSFYHIEWLKHFTRKYKKILSQMVIFPWNHIELFTIGLFEYLLYLWNVEVIQDIIWWNSLWDITDNWNFAWIYQFGWIGENIIVLTSLIYSRNNQFFIDLCKDRTFGNERHTEGMFNLISLIISNEYSNQMFRRQFKSITFLQHQHTESIICSPVINLLMVHHVFVCCTM